MKKDELIKRKKELEDEHMSLKQEIADMDHLMRLAGFSNGLETVKATAKELLRYKQEENLPREDEAA